MNWFATVCDTAGVRMPAQDYTIWNITQRHFVHCRRDLVSAQTKVVTIVAMQKTAGEGLENSPASVNVVNQTGVDSTPTTTIPPTSNVSAAK